MEPCRAGVAQAEAGTWSESAGRAARASPCAGSLALSYKLETSGFFQGTSYTSTSATPVVSFTPATCTL